MKRFLFLLILIISGSSVYALDSDEGDEVDPYYILADEADRAYASGNIAEAIARTKDAISVRPEAPENVLLLCNLGNIYGSIGRLEDALAALNDAYSLAPHMRVVLLARGKVHMEMANLDAAKEDFRRVVELDSLNADAHFYLGFISFYTNDKAEASRHFDVLKAVEPESLRTARTLAVFYADNFREEEALPYFKTLLAAEPEAAFYAMYIECLVKTGHLSDAAAAVAEGMEKFPDDPNLYLGRAMLNKARYRLDDARADADHAVKLGIPRAHADKVLNQ